MGTYRIVIEGTGSHHNTGRPSTDANQIAAVAVASLKRAGQNVTKASFDLVDQNGKALLEESLLHPVPAPTPAPFPPIGLDSGGTSVKGSH